MSFLNGLGAGFSAFAAAGIKDQADAAAAAAATPVRAPLLNATPAPASVESTPAAAPTAAAPAAAPGGSATVPPALLPLYQAASKRTGIPVDVLVAQAKQESGFDPSVVSSSGGIGLHQIQAATARDPGYGLAPVDPATLKDPAVNINFAASYMAAKAGGHVDWSDPKQVNAALAAYNGGGDRNYAQNVRRYMGSVA